MPRTETALTRRGWSLLGAASGLLVAGRLLGTPELTTLGLSAGLLIARGVAGHRLPCAGPFGRREFTSAETPGWILSSKPERRRRS